MKDTKATALSWGLSLCIADAMAEKLAESILTLDLRNISQTVADCFVICSARNESHVHGIVTHIEKQTLSDLQQRPWFIEGTQTDQWVVLDYVDVVAHVFMPVKRAHYALEELWGDAPTQAHLDSTSTHEIIDTHNPSAL